MSSRKKKLILDALHSFNWRPDNARSRREFKTTASFRFLAILARELLVRL
jgi:hypothetical protein